MTLAFQSHVKSSVTRSRDHSIPHRPFHIFTSSDSFFGKTHSLATIHIGYVTVDRQTQHCSIRATVKQKDSKARVYVKIIIVAYDNF